MNRKMPTMFISCILSFTLFFALFPTLVRAGSEQITRATTVKVGYFDFPGYQEIADTGKKSGYGYEYIQEIRKYTNWNYEYVYAPYEECLTLLKEGKIDLLTSVPYSETDDEFFDYSASPIGTKSSILTVKSSNAKYSPGEYRAFDGMHVGLLSGNESSKKFKELSEVHHFSYTYDDSFSNTEELCKALQDGKVDAIITGNLRKTNNERIIAEFDSCAYYAAVRAGNQKLLYELNNAIEKINLMNPVYQSTLYQKYYAPDSPIGVAFSPEELEYIKKNPERSILIPPSMRPMAYSEDGIVKGIEPDTIRKALEPSGLKLNFIMFDSAEELIKAIENPKKYPVIGLVINTAYNAEVSNMRLTAPYLTINYSIVTKGETPQENVTVAVAKKESAILGYVNQHYKKEQIKFYENAGECVEAVLNGEVTQTVMNSYIAENVIANDAKNRLVSNTIMGYHVDFVMSVDSNTDYLLYSIINKCVNALSPDDARAILMEDTSYKEQAFSIMKYLYRYPIQVIAFITFIFAVLLAVIVVATRQKRLKKEQQVLEETAQFAKIATEATGEITELGFQDMHITNYSFADKKLIKKRTLMPKDLQKNITDIDLIYPDDLSEYRQIFSKESLLAVAGTEMQKTCTLRIKEVDGNYYWMLFTVQGLPVDEIYPNNLMIFKKNVDDLKRKEMIRQQQLTDALNTAKAASEAKGAFMSRMSHEIRTPLNGVIGYMTIAKSNTKNIDKVNDCITKAEIAAKHLLSIINDVLDMSSIESGKLKMAHASFDLREVISAISAIFYMQAQVKDVHFETITNNISEDYLIGDSLRVKQILMNLLSNAVKFTPRNGNVYLTVEQTAIKNKVVFIKFIVADNGIGMTPEFKEKLFQPFEQQDASIAQNYGGSGLGLSITKNLITMMNGVIDVQSEKGKGTIFTVELPFEEDLSVEKCKGKQDFSHIHALIVDDEIGTCEYMNLLLERCGVKSEFATSGTQAVDKIKKAHQSNQPFNMCLLDWKMPDMDGMNTVKQIRTCVGADMPIIIVTAYDFSEIEEEARATGVDLFISKPLFQSTMFDLLVDTYGKNKIKENIPEKELCTFAGRRLLLAEDNQMNREIAVDILSAYGFAVDCAENGEIARNLFEKSKPGTYAAILMDVQMPVMDGYQATKVIRESKHIEAQTIIIIAMTANAFVEDIAASHAAGMNDHISKPIDVDQMLVTLKKHIK